MNKLPYHVGARVVFLPIEQEYAFGGGRDMIEHELLPGTYYYILSTDSSDGICVGAGKEAHADNFRLASTLPPCSWKRGNNVAWVPKIETFPAMRYAPEFSIAVMYVQGVRHPMAEEWEKLYNKHGIYFNKPYEIEDIIDGVALKLKGVEEPFYWEFFRQVNNKEKET